MEVAVVPLNEVVGPINTIKNTILDIFEKHQKRKKKQLIKITTHSSLALPL